MVLRFILPPSEVINTLFFLGCCCVSSCVLLGNMLLLSGRRSKLKSRARMRRKTATLTRVTRRALRWTLTPSRLKNPRRVLGRAACRSPFRQASRASSATLPRWSPTALLLPNSHAPTPYPHAAFLPNPHIGLRRDFLPEFKRLSVNVSIDTPPLSSRCCLP